MRKISVVVNYGRCCGARLRGIAACAVLFCMGFPATAGAQSSGEIIIDNTDPGAEIVAGNFWIPVGGEGFEGTDHVTTQNGQGGVFRWTPDLSDPAAAGEYEVFVKYAADWFNLGKDVPYTVSHGGRADIVLIDQTRNGGEWVPLGRFALAAGDFVSVGADLPDDKRPSVDAVRFIPVASLPYPELDEFIIDNTDPGAEVVAGNWWVATLGEGFEGSDHLTTATGSGGLFRWSPDMAGTVGDYEIFVKYAANWQNSGAEAPYAIWHKGGFSLIDVDQTQQGGEWVSLGEYTIADDSFVALGADMPAGTRPNADAVRFVRLIDSQPRRLNFVVILTDDQRWDTLDSMPVSLNRIAERGVRFENAFVSTPVCGPLRANLISGGFYAYNTGIIMNPGANGGEVLFREQDDDTLATALQAEGYATMFAGGKYLNGYRPPYIPPGWTRFVNNTLGPSSSGWYNYDVVKGSSSPDESSVGTIETVQQYVTDYHRDEVLDFLDDTDGNFFVFYSVFAPHAPAIPFALDDDLFDGYRYRGRAWRERDLSDKPDWVTNPDRYHWVKEPDDEFQRDQLRSLQSLDRAIGDIVDKVEAIGELDRTVFIFTSDNGYLWGEHGLYTKGMAYEESIRVPFMMAGPGIAPGTTDDNLVMVDLDIGATIFDMAGIDKPSDGETLTGILEDPQAPFRDELYFQQWGPLEGAFGMWGAVRTDQWKYVENVLGEVELYDLSVDPFEQESLHLDPNFAAIRDQFAQRLQDRLGLGMSVSVPPPGRVGRPFSFSLYGWGGEPPYTWAVESGELPPGLTLDPETGEVSGTPLEAGEFRARLSVESQAIASRTGRPQKVIGPMRAGFNITYRFLVNPEP